jgi:hypothetical protein
VFEPRAVVWHHDASPAGDSPGVPAYLAANWQTASAQCWVDRYGVWHLIGAGRAPHAGAVLPGKPGNSTSIGVETDHTTGEPWPAPQLNALRRGTRAILTHLRVQPDPGLEFHRTICAPPGRKSDPHGLDLAAERAAVANEGDDDVSASDVWGFSLPQKNGVGPAPTATWLQDTLLAVYGIDAKVNALAARPPVAVDAAAVAAALAKDPAFTAAIAKAVNDDAAKRLAN